MGQKQTYKGTVAAIAATAANQDLDATAFAALTWTDIRKCGNSGEWSTVDNALVYNTLDEAVSGKQKGVRNAGDPVLEVARDVTDAGQDILRTAANNYTDAFAVKRTLPDGTVQYSRAVVMGPERPGGGPDDFVLERFTLGLVQLLVEVEPA